MLQAPHHPHESARIAALHRLGLLDTDPEGAFDIVTTTLAHALRVPIALVSLIDRDRQWFKSRVGLDLPETSREPAFCAHAMLGDGPMVVEDATRDERFADNPLVAGEPGICFYAGEPLRLPDGLPIGTLCVIDRLPRAPDQRELAVLAGHARLIEREIWQRAERMSAQAAADESRKALAESDGLFRSVFELSAVGIALVAPSGRFLRANLALCRLVGYSADELAGLTFQSITHPDDLQLDLDLLAKLVAGEISQYRIDKRYISKRGHHVWAQLTVAARFNDDGSVHSFVSMVEDIGLRKTAEEQRASLAATLEKEVLARTQELRDLVRQSERRNEQMRSMSEAAAMLVAAHDVAEMATILERHLPRIFDHVRGAFYIGDRDGYVLASCWGAEAAAQVITTEECWALRRGTEYRVDAHNPLRCNHLQDHETMGGSCSPILAAGECVGLLTLQWSDDAAPDTLLVATLVRKLGLALTNLHLREELRRQALHDPLTGLYNRRHLAEFLVARLAHSRRRHQECALLMVDIDHFKQLNDCFGHDYGDQVLIEVAGLLKSCLRAEEAAFRYGGEEFVIVLTVANADDGRLCAERLRNAVAAMRLPARGRTAAPQLTVSIGVAASPDAGVLPEALLTAADEALYAAKTSGRNRVVSAKPITLSSVQSA